MGTTHGRAAPDSALDLFDHVLGHAPGSPAVTGVDGTRSYRELDQVAWSLHDALVAAGTRHGSRVAFVGEQDWNFPALVLAVFRAGAVFVPLDPSWPAARTSGIVSRAGVHVVATTGQAGEQLAREHGIASVLVPEAAAAGAGTPHGYRPPRTGAAYLTFTSGTTGTPKGVLTSHGALAGLAGRLSKRLGMDATNKVLQYHPAAVDIALEELAIAWAVGGTTVALPDALRTDLSAFTEHLETFQVGVADLPTAFWLVWLEAIERGDVRPPGPALRVVGVGGEPVPHDAIRRWTGLPGVEAGLFNLFGSTETGVTTVVDGPLTASGSAVELTSSSVIGLPLDGVVHHVLDDDLRPVPQGQPGQLYLSGSVAALGYDGDPRRTARAFVPDPFAERPGTRMYAMGDEVRELPDGRIEYRGRIDQTIFVHGHTVHPAEIEKVLGAVPGVRSAHVHTDQVDTVTRLVADLVPEAPDNGVVQGWREVYDALYASDTTAHPAELDTRTWLSAVDGQPMPREVMESWRDDVVAKIRAERPRRVLDLGCGTGMILHGIAADLDRYVGVDFSAPGLSALQDSAADRWPGLDAEFVETDIATALGSVDELFDVVVLNSVVQYLPDAHELRRVLDLAARAVAPGGVVVVGDVRNLDLDSGFRDWLHAQANHSLRGGRTGDESELVLSPAYFTSLAELGGRPVRADVTVKYTDDDSEMTLFRFDAVLRLDAPPVPATADAIVHSGLGAARLAEAELGSLVAPGVPVVVRDVLRAADGDHREPTAVRIGELRRRVAADGLRLEAAPAAHSPRLVDVVVFTPADHALALGLLREARPHDPGRALANDPRAVLDQQLVLAADTEARARLRDHERPSRYRVLRGSEFVTVTPQRVQATASEPAHDALSPLEQGIASIWSLVLGQVPAPEDDFFDLGGNSLNLARVLVRLRSSYGIALSAQDFFTAPTVRRVARLVADRVEGPAADARAETLPVGVETTGPASLAQERLWLLDELHPGSRAYHSPFAFDVEGTLDVEAVQVAARAVAERHPVLRTALRMEDGMVVQAITERDVEVREIVVAPEDGPPVPGTLSRAELDFVATPFSLDDGLVFRIGWTRLAQSRHRLVFVLHHVAVDELSLPPLFEDFGTAYRAAARGTTPALPAVPARYLDYARWERSAAASSAHGREFWRDYLAGAPTLVRFPVGRDRPVVRSGRGSRHPIAGAPAVGADVERCLRREGLTPYQFWLGVFGLFLSREVGSPDVLVGVPSANRGLAETEGVVGFFVNTLPVRIDLRANPTAAEHLADTARSLLSAQSHEGVALQAIVEAAGATRDAAHNPLFQTMVVLEPDDELRLDLGDARGAAVDLAETTSTVDLTLIVRGSETGPRPHFVYNPDLFSATEVERMAHTFGSVLHAVLADPDRRTGDSVPPAPEHASVQRGQSTGTASLQPVHLRVAETAQRFPHRTAVISADGEWDYETLADATNRAAAAISAAALGSDLPPFIPLVMDSGPWLVAAMLAVNRLGSAFAPVSPDWPAARIEAVLDDLGSPFCVTAGGAPSWLGARGQVVLPAEQTGPALPAPALPPPAADLGAAMYAIFTSGSTGTPKAAAVSHLGVANRIEWMTSRFGESASRRVLQTTPPHLDSCVWEYFWPLVNGGTTVLGTPALHLDPAALSAVIAERGITTIDMVPGLFRDLLGHVGADPAALEGLRCLEVAVVGGEELTTAVAELVTRVGLGVAVYNLYGPTEASIGSIFHRLTEDSGAPIPIGHPIDNTTALVLDDNFVPVPAGVRGELFLGGACVGLGYPHDRAQTRARFVDLPGEGRLYRTGDLARVREDGALEFLGRRDRQFNLNGVRVESGEITRALLSIDGVAEAGVIGTDAVADDPRELLTALVLDAHTSADPGRRAAAEAVLVLMEQER
ncbi:amino acid adenylation domain-containing protein [Lentzea sp. NPDC058436]|uniref:non-ribosomal peptide synthetase n=1 Tax=Lentzea sp. NPDC058436 TaxID=3346499 RepID=UPI0036630A68